MGGDIGDLNNPENSNAQSIDFFAFELFGKMMPNCKRLLELYMPLHNSMGEANIDTPLRICAFCAQICWESDSLNHWEEQGSDEYFSRYDPPNHVAVILGNVNKGDGLLYKGRSPIQCTGRDLYTRCSRAIGVDLVNHPEKALEVDIGFKITTWYWTMKGLNAWADQDNIDHITLLINGGMSAASERKALYMKNKQLMGLI